MARGSAITRMALPILGAAYYFYLRPRMLQIGTEPGEAGSTFPGDDRIPSPNYQATRAINISASPHVVWSWLVQIGRDGNGYYGMDSLTNQGVPSVAYLRKDLPVLQTGIPLDGGYRILALESEHILLYGGFDIPTIGDETMERTTLLMLDELSDGNTRLVIRTRGYTYGLLGPIYNLYYEIVDYANTLAQLQNIKQRAEVLTRLQAPLKSS